MSLALELPTEEEINKHDESNGVDTVASIVVDHSNKKVVDIIKELLFGLGLDEWHYAEDFWSLKDSPDPEFSDLSLDEAYKLNPDDINPNLVDSDVVQYYEYADRIDTSCGIYTLKLVHDPNIAECGSNEMLEVGYNPYRKKFLVLNYQPRNVYEKKVCDYLLNNSFGHYQNLTTSSSIPKELNNSYGGKNYEY